MFGLRHPSEKRLLSAYIAERTGDLPDPRLTEHLVGCASCTARYTGVARFMDRLRQEADVELEVHFPADRLETQRLHIARRLEHVGHAARVISFPARATDAATRARSTHRGSRWVAAAAVAGLVVGLVLGALSNENTPVAPVEVAVAPVGAEEPLMLRAPMDEDTFLQELELAGIRQRVQALRPLDAFTPTVQEVTTQVR
jgi:hypothetical protein